MENTWVKTSERLPKKVDGRIRSNAVLVTVGNDWTIAEYHFNCGQWISIMGTCEVIEPEYWQEVILPKELQ